MGDILGGFLDVGVFLGDFRLALYFIRFYKTKHESHQYDTGFGKCRGRFDPLRVRDEGLLGILEWNNDWISDYYN